MIELKDYTNGKKEKYFLINNKRKSQSFAYSKKQDMLDDVDTLGFEDYRNGKIKDINQPYKLVNWQVKEGKIRVRKDG